VAFGGGVHIDAQDWRTLFVIYGAGYAGVSLILALLYLHAWQKRTELALNPLESPKTRFSLINHSAMIMMGLTSATLASVLPQQLIGFAGYAYFAIGVYFMLANPVQRKREAKVLVAPTSLESQNALFDLPTTHSEISPASGQMGNKADPESTN
jgi:hypothetical protein